MGVANIHVKKNQGLAFHRTGDRPEALLCPIVMKSVTNKHPRMWDFFSRTAHQYPKFSVEFNKKKSKTKRKTAAENWFLPSTLPTFSLWPFRTGVLHAIESLFSKFSNWPNLPGRAKCGRLWRRERMGICTWIWQCSHSCALSGKNSKCEESNECFQRAMNRCGVPPFLSFTIRACGIRRLLRHHLLPGWSLGQLQALIFHQWDLLWVRKEGESKVERSWFSVSANSKNVPASSLATQSLSRGFVCAYAALHGALSYAMTYSHKPHCFELNQNLSSLSRPVVCSVWSSCQFFYLCPRTVSSWDDFKQPVDNTLI